VPWIDKTKKKKGNGKFLKEISGTLNQYGEDKHNRAMHLQTK